MDRYYTPEEIAESLKVSRETVYNWIRSHRLRAVKASNFWRITETELNRFLGASTDPETTQEKAEEIPSSSPPPRSRSRRKRWIKHHHRRHRPRAPKPPGK